MKLTGKAKYYFDLGKKQKENDIISQVKKKNLKSVICDSEDILFKKQTPGPTIGRPSLYFLLGLNEII